MNWSCGILIASLSILSLFSIVTCQVNQSLVFPLNSTRSSKRAFRQGMFSTYWGSSIGSVAGPSFVIIVVVVISKTCCSSIASRRCIYSSWVESCSVCRSRSLFCIAWVCAICCSSVCAHVGGLVDSCGCMAVRGSIAYYYYFECCSF
jgi:hypothetical protein